MEDDVIASIRRDLLKSADQKTRESAGRFFKEEAKFHGVKSKAVRDIARERFREVKGRGKEEIFSMCESLLMSDYTEEASIAFEWAYALRGDYRPEDFEVFESWIERYVNNWAKCDTLCNHAVASFVEQYPDYIGMLKSWARSENRWFRRASAVTLILPARKGKFLQDVFEISDILLEDKDDLVQKGYGWMLKEASKSHQDEVYSYVMRNKGSMPRTALRYAIEKMPEGLRRSAMARPS
jgi:3-methyladenine DNA glycosylase AlkD